MSDPSFVPEFDPSFVSICNPSFVPIFVLFFNPFLFPSSCSAPPASILKKDKDTPSTAAAPAAESSSSSAPAVAEPHSVTSPILPPRGHSPGPQRSLFKHAVAANLAAKTIKSSSSSKAPAESGGDDEEVLSPVTFASPSKQRNLRYNLDAESSSSTTTGRGAGKGSAQKPRSAFALLFKPRNPVMEQDFSGGEGGPPGESSQAPGSTADTAPPPPNTSPSKPPAAATSPTPK